LKKIKRLTNYVCGYGSTRGVTFFNELFVIYIFDSAASRDSYISASVCVFCDSVFWILGEKSTMSLRLRRNRQQQHLVQW